MENCWTNVGNKRKKREGRRKKGEKSEKKEKKWKKGEKWRTKVDRREKERREGWEAQKAESLLHDTANVVGILPSISRPPLHEQRPCSNRLGKKTKKTGKKRIEGTIMTKPSKNFWHQAQRNDLGQTPLVQELAQQLRKNHRKCHKTDRTQFLPLSKFIKHVSKTWQKRQIDVQN